MHAVTGRAGFKGGPTGQKFPGREKACPWHRISLATKAGDKDKQYYTDNAIPPAIRTASSPTSN